MIRIENGHWRCGIYHARRQTGAGWLITVEDGKGLPFTPMRVPTLRAFRRWVSE